MHLYIYRVWLHTNSIYGYKILEMLSKIEDEVSMQLCTAERSLLYSLEGGCQVRPTSCSCSI